MSHPHWNKLIANLLPNRQDGELHLARSLGGGMACFTIQSENICLLEEISRNLYLNRNLNIWRNVPQRGYHIVLDFHRLKGKCDELNIKQESLLQELKEANAIIGQSTLTICLPISEVKFDLDGFKKAYEQDYNSTLFHNPWSSMKLALNRASLNFFDHPWRSIKSALGVKHNSPKALTEEEIINYAKEHPKSRTARVLTKLQYSEDNIETGEKEEPNSFRLDK